jgi:ABC-2 type transport system permease protein
MMKLQKILAIAGKDLLEVRQNTSAWLPMIIIPLIFVVVLPMVILWAPRSEFFTDQVMADPDMMSFFNQLPPSLTQYTQGMDMVQSMVVMFLGFMFAPMFLIMPIMFSTIIAAESFAGERERKTLEALLYTPTTDGELFLGKMVAAGVPALLLTWGSFLLYTIILNVAGFSLMNGLWFPIPTWWPLIFWVAPALSLLGISATVLISEKTQTFMGAYQMSGSLVVLVLALFIGQVTGVLYLSVVVGLLLGLVIWIAAAALTWLAISKFNRTALLLHAS